MAARQTCCGRRGWLVVQGGSESGRQAARCDERDGYKGDSHTGEHGCSLSFRSGVCGLCTTALGVCDPRRCALSSRIFPVLKVRPAPPPSRSFRQTPREAPPRLLKGAPTARCADGPRVGRVPSSPARCRLPACPRSAGAAGGDEPDGRTVSGRREYMRSPYGAEARAEARGAVAAAKDRQGTAHRSCRAPSPRVPGRIGGTAGGCRMTQTFA